MLTGIHLLLTYACTSECDHCFVYSSPRAAGTFALEQIAQVLTQAAQLATVGIIYFEGGEPFLYYPLMLEGIRLARDLGFKTGVVTNAYFATTVQDAMLWLGPLQELGVSDLSLSDDAFHFDTPDNAAKRALEAARSLGLPVGTICIEPPRVEAGAASREKGAPIVGGDVMFRGRAAEKLTEGLPRRDWREFTECPHEDLRNPDRVHVDAYGWVHLCQGLTMGNLWEKPLAAMVAGYDPDAHPIIGPLLRGGPARLAEEHGLSHEEGYVDACHLCYSMRKALIGCFPSHLAPKQVYGLG
ncbi:MAG: radical SAM protein [Anaerolineae bacterium]|nr:radical SAM protein [Anaerolineae bacterium]